MLSLTCQSLSERQRLLPTLEVTLPAGAANAVATSAPALRPTPTWRPTPTSPPPDSGWQPVRDGMERRVMNLISAEGEWQESITLLRLDPSRFRFDVAYRPGDPL